MITRNSLVKRAHNILTEAMDKSMNAPIKRGYSALAGVQIPSKRDILQGAKQNLQTVNQVAETFGFEPVWNDPDAEDVDLGSVE